MSNDEQLLSELREALLTAADVPAGFVAAGKSAFAWRTVDAELAALSDQFSADDAFAGTRTERAAVRALSFHASGLSIELEVTSDGLLGQLVPPRSGQVQVQTHSGPGPTVTVDETGWFVIRPLLSTMFRLCVRTATDNVVTEWATL